MNEANSMNIKQFAVTAQCKAEAYDRFTVMGGYCLPPLEQANADYIADIMSGQKLVG